MSWDAWTKCLEEGGVADVYGIFGAADSNYQAYHSNPSGYNPGPQVFQQFDRLMREGAGSVTSISMDIPLKTGTEKLKFMILRSDDNSAQGKYKNIAGFSVSKTAKGLFVLSIYTHEGVNAGNCNKVNGRVKDQLEQAGF